MNDIRKTQSKKDLIIRLQNNYNDEMKKISIYDLDKLSELQNYTISKLDELTDGELTKILTNKSIYKNREVSNKVKKDYNIINCHVDYNSLAFELVEDITYFRSFNFDYLFYDKENVWRPSPEDISDCINELIKEYYS